MESVVSREASFLFNNLLFVAFAFAVLWGVLFPQISETLRGETIAVSTPYYDFFAVAFGLPLLLLAGIGPVIAWRRASLQGVARALPLVVHHRRLRRARPRAARLRHVRARRRRAQPLPVRGHDRRARAGPRHDRAARAGAGHLVARGLRTPDRAQQAPLRRLHRAPGRRRRRDRDRRHERLRHHRGGHPAARPDDARRRLRADAAARRARAHRERPRHAARCSRSRATASRSARSRPASGTSRARARRRTRSRSARRWRRGRTCSRSSTRPCPAAACASRCSSTRSST